MSHDTLFSIKDFQKTATLAILQKIENLAAKKGIIQKWQDAFESGKLDYLTETQLDGEFLRDIFCEVLGYTSAVGSNSQEWELTVKGKTDIDGTIPDATLGYFAVNKPNDVRIIIELKGANINLDKPQNRKGFKGSPIEQGFSYFPKYSDKCNWLILSNFEEIRLYHRNMGIRKYESFLLTDLLEEDNLKKFFFLLNQNQLYLLHEESPVNTLFAERRAKEKTITEEFYYQYSAFREDLFFGLRRNNANYPNAELIRCTQKIIDRILFMCFVRDTLQIGDILGRTMLAVNELFYEQEDKLWQNIQRTFHSFNKGFTVRKGSLSIPSFNGGLFAPDKILEKLSVLDIYIEPIIEFFLKYDFQSELNVNILGHIFEQSITDLENFKREIETQTLTEEDAEKRENKRKRDGVFYTPEYITDYIIGESLGRYLEEKRNELLAQFETENLSYWNAYKEILKQIKIVDPACGSGAFLTKIVDFLYTEWAIIYKETAKLSPKIKTKKQAKVGLFEKAKEDVSQEWEIKKQIVSNNIYGVDLNIESVEITKLSLWLKTANRQISLSDLSSNILQGNSLIHDGSVTPLAFDWDKRFPKVIQNGGFEVVVGNPPYVSANNMSFSERQYFNTTTQYTTLKGKWDLYVPFLERSLKLVRNQGFLSFIIPYGILNQPFAKDIRKLVLENYSLVSIVDLQNDKIFDEATVPTCILLINASSKQREQISILHLQETLKMKEIYKVPKEYYYQSDTYMFRTENIAIGWDLLTKIKHKGSPLGEYFYVSTGAEIHGKEERTDEGVLISGHSKFDLLKDKFEKGLKPYIEGATIPKQRRFGRYCFPKIKYYLDYDKNVSFMRSSKFKELFENEKIILRASSGSSNIIGTLDKRQIYTSHKNILIINYSSLPASRKGNKDTTYSLSVLLAILNSKLMDYYYQHVYSGFIDVYPSSLKGLPIVLPSLEQEKEIEVRVQALLAHHAQTPKMISDFWELMRDNFKTISLKEAISFGFSGEWAEALAFLQKQKANLKPKQQTEWKEMYLEQREGYLAATKEIQRLDNEIDTLVCQLYALNEEETKILLEYERED
jgi:hypothetical protein